MFGSLSIEAQIREKLPQLGCSVSVLAGVVQTSQTRLSQGLSGTKSLPSTELIETLKIVKKMESIAKAAYPLQLSWSDPNAIRKLLQDIDDGTLRICIIRNEMSVEEKSFVIQFRNGRYFATQDRNGQPLETLNQAHGARMTHTVAVELVSIFEGLGYKCKIEESSFAGDPAFEVSQLWHESAVQAESEVSA
jgi:hypothetical protein